MPARYYKFKPNKNARNEEIRTFQLAYVVNVRNLPPTEAVIYIALIMNMGNRHKHTAAINGKASSSTGKFNVNLELNE
jgi:hypothetical protein